MARQSGVSDAVFKALRKYANQEVHYSDIVADTGLTDIQVMGAISHLKRHSEINIISVRKGWYLYKPGGGAQKVVAVKAKAEVVALLEDGTVLLTIEGRLFLASELEIQ